MEASLFFWCVMDHWFLSPWYLTAMATMAAIFGRLPQQQQDVLAPPCGSCPAFGPRILLCVSTPTFYICSSPQAPECRSEEKKQSAGKTAEGSYLTWFVKGDRISVRKSQLMELLWVSKSAIYPPPRQEYTGFPGVCSKALMWPKKEPLTLNV